MKITFQTILQDCVDEAWLVQLFDPVTSPRCFGIISTKKSAT